MAHHILDYIHRYIMIKDNKAQMFPQKGIEKLNIKIKNPKTNMKTGFHISRIIAKHANGTYLIELK